MAKRLKTKLIVIGATLLAGLVVLEITARVITYRSTPPGLAFDDDLIFTARPHATLWNVELNDIGAIGPDVATPKREGETRVFLLGGSTSYSPTYATAVDAAVRERNPDADLTVVTCGRPRYTSYNNLVNLRKNLLAYEPDVVVCYLGINDAIYNAFPFTGPLPDVGYFDWRAKDASLFATLVKYHFLDKRFRAGSDFGEPPFRSEAMLESHLREIVALGREHGFRVVLSTFAVSQPTTDRELIARVAREEELMRHFWGGVPSTLRAVARHNAVIERLATEFDLPLANVRDAIPHTSEFFTDLCHMTPAGQALLGAEIGRALGTLPWPTAVR